MNKNNSLLISSFKRFNRRNSSTQKEKLINNGVTTDIKRDNDKNEKEEDNNLSFDIPIIDDDLPKKQRNKKSVDNRLKKKRNNQKNKRKIPYLNENNQNDIGVSNELSVLDDCYNKLTELISQYSFIDISKIILKLMNDIAQEEDDNDKLFKEIKNIISKVKNKESIAMMCLSILSVKYSLNNDKDDNFQKSHQKKEKNEKRKVNKVDKREKIDPNKIKRKENNKKTEAKNNLDEKNKKMSFINATKEKMKFLMKNAKKYNFYYKNDQEEIFSYRCKNITKKEPFLYYCFKDKCKCRAICRINNNFSYIKLERAHNHIKGIIKSLFYNSYPFLVKEIWKYVQIFRMEDKVIVVRIC